MEEAIQDAGLIAATREYIHLCVSEDPAAAGTTGFPVFPGAFMEKVSNAVVTIPVADPEILARGGELRVHKGGGATCPSP